MFNLQIVQENNEDMEKFEAILLEQLAAPTHVNFESQFSQNFYKKLKCLEVKKRYCAERSLTTRIKSFTNKQ